MIKVGDQMILDKRTIKRLLLRIFFLGQILVFGVNYTMGTHGLRTLWTVNKNNCRLQKKIDILHQELQDLEQQKNSWNSDPFLKEKVAREQLQLAKADEDIYLI